MQHWFVLVVVYIACSLAGHAHAWVAQYQPFPEGHATVVQEPFCLSQDCGSLSDLEWYESINRARRTWNNSDADFYFYSRAKRDTDDPCNLPGEVVIIISNDGSACLGDRFGNYGEVGGRTEFGNGNLARIYIRERGGAYRTVLLFLVHEFGHVVGLGHPDEHSQNVSSVMNSTVIDLSSSNPLDPSLRQDDIDGVYALYGEKKVRRVGRLENPTPRGNGQIATPQSGIGLISGWVCEADRIEIQIIDVGKEPEEEGYLETHVAAYGTERLDTQKVCGDTNNGFGLLFNWNRLGEGEYVVSVVAYDGRGVGWFQLIPWARARVTTLGEEFLRGAEGEYVLEDFPEPGQSVTVEWSQGLQNFVIMGREE